MSFNGDKAKKIISEKGRFGKFFAEILITLPKIAEGTHQTLRFKWVFELFEF